MKKVAIIDWEIIAYQDAWDRQTAHHKALIHQKLSVRDQLIPKKLLSHKLIFCQHNHVYTLGKSGKIDHLLLDKAARTDQEVDFYKINRGGDITYHGPGQLVVYPILDLDEFYTDVHKYVRMLEEIVIRTLAHYGLDGIRLNDFTGVWLAAEKSKPLRKICAIGVHLSRWVSMHGLALNVNTDLSYFDGIVPCGIATDDKKVTSISNELGRVIDMNELMEKMKPYFKELFGFEYIN